MRVEIQLESAWLVGSRQAPGPRVLNISATLRTTTLTTAAGVSVNALSEVPRRNISSSPNAKKKKKENSAFSENSTLRNDP